MSVNLGSAIGTIELDISKLQTALTTAQQSTKSAMDGIKQSGDTAGKSLATAFEQAGSKMQAAGGKMTAIGGTLTKAVTLPLAGFGIAAFKSASDFETSMAKVSTIADGTQKPMQEMEKEVRNVAKTYGTSADDIAEATYQAISAGVDTGKSVAFVGEMNKLAIGGFTDVTTAVDTVTTVLNAYGLEAEDASHVSDVLIQTQNKGKTSVDELAGSIGKLIPIAGANNVSVEQLGQAYSVMTANGVKTAESTTMMKALFGELGKEGSASADILQQKTGKSFKELSDEGVSLRDVLQIVSDGAAEQGKSFEGVFSSSEAAGAGLVLMNTEQSAYNESLGEFLTASGDTEAAYAKMANTAEFRLAVAFQTAVDAMRLIGDVLKGLLVPYIEQAVEKIAQLAEWWENLDQKHQETIVKVGLVAAAIGPLLVVGGKLTSGIGGLVGQFGKLIPAIAGVGAPVIAVVAIVGVLVAAFLHLWKTNEAFRDAITGIWGGIKDSFSQLASGITDAVNKLGFDFENFGQVAGAAWEGFTSILGPLFTGAFAFIASDLQVFVSTFTGVLNIISTVIKTAVDVWKGIFDFWIAVFTGDWEGAWNAIKGIFESVLSGIGDVFQSFLGIISGIWEGITSKLSAAGDVIGGVFGAIGGFFGKGKDDAQQAADGITDAMQGMGDAVTTSGDTTSSAFDAMSASITDSVGQIPPAVGSSTTEASSLLSSFAADATTAGTDAGKGMTDGLTRGLAPLPSVVETQTASGMSVAQTYSSMMANEGTTAGDGYSASLATGLATATTNTETAGASIASTLQQTATDALTQGQATGTGYTDSLGAGLANATTVTQTATSGAVTSAQQTTAEMQAAGQQAGEGYSTGLNTGLQNAVTAVGTAMTGIVGAAQVATSDLTTSGQTAGQGFAQGLNAGLQTAVVAVSTAMIGIVGAAQVATSAMTTAGTQAGQGFANGLKAGLTTAVTAVGIVMTGIVGATNVAKAQMTTAGQQAGQGFATGLKAGLTSAVTAVSVASTGMIGAAKVAAASMTAQGQAAGKGFSSGIKSGMSTVTTSVQSEFNKAKTAATAFTSAMKTAGTQAGKGFSDGFKSGISSLTTNLQSELNKAKNAISSFASSATSQMRSAGVSMASAVSSGFSGAGNWSSLGAAVAQGIASGINANTGAIKSAAINAAMAALSAAQAALGINSPSRVMADKVGKWIPEGIALGVKDIMPKSALEIQKQINNGIIGSMDTTKIFVQGNTIGEKLIDGIKQGVFGINDVVKYLGVSVDEITQAMTTQGISLDMFVQQHEDALRSVEEELQVFEEKVKHRTGKIINSFEAIPTAFSMSAKDMLKNLKDNQNKYADWELTITEITKQLGPMAAEHFGALGVPATRAMKEILGSTDLLEEYKILFGTKIDETTKKAINDFEAPDFIGAPSKAMREAAEKIKKDDAIPTVFAVQDEKLKEQMDKTTASMKSSGKSGGAGYASAMKTAVAPVKSDVQSTTDKTLTTTKQFGADLQKSGSSGGQAFADSIKRTTAPIPTDIKSVLDKATQQIQTFSKNSIATLEVTGRQMEGAVTSGFNASNGWSGLGAGVAQGIAGGITSAIGAIRDAAINAAKAALDAAKAALGINSPSKVMHDEVGKWIPLGIAEGFVAFMPQATEEMQAALLEATSSLNTDLELNIMAQVGDTYVDAYERIQKLVLISQEGLQDSIQELKETKISGGAIRVANARRAILPDAVQLGDKPRTQEQGDTFVFNETGLDPQQVARLVRATKHELELGFA